METAPTFSCLDLRRHNQLLPVAVLEETRVMFHLLSREENVSVPDSDCPGGVAAVHLTCEHMGIC